MRESKYETIRIWMMIANYYQERIETYQKMSGDGEEHPKVRAYAKSEVEYQTENLKDLLESVRSHKDPFSNALILKYFEGYTLDEAALAYGISANYMKDKHAELIGYLKQYKEQPPQREKFDLEKFSKAIDEYLYPKYKVCCEHCGSNIEIQPDTVRKIVRNENRKARALARRKKRSR